MPDQYVFSQSDGKVSADRPWVSRFAGDPAPNTATEPIAGSESSPSLIEKVKIGVAETAKSFRIDMWLARQTPEKVLPVLEKVIEGAKEEFADAVANGGGIYAVGYCFGGKYVLLLGSELPGTVTHSQATEDVEQGVVKSEPLIKAGALAHGELVSQILRIICLMISRNTNNQGGS